MRRAGTGRLFHEVDMAGTIPNLPLSTQFDKDSGAPLRGGKLHFFQAGTIATPQVAYKDTGLSLAHPNPITLDGAGRVPSFYLADGAIHIRLTNAQGVTQFEELSLLVVGPSSGSGGGGTTVDPTSVFQTGDVIWLDQAGTRAGWVRDNGRTIGSATSGASERANSDCQNLFTFLRNTYDDTVCPVNGGRGASAAADWAANKWITLPDKRGYAPGGLDDMGNAAASRYAGVPFTAGNATAAGSLCGEAAHALSGSETGPHIHPVFLDDPGHDHFIAPDHGTVAILEDGGGSQGPTGSGETLIRMTKVQASTTNITVRDAAGGAGTANQTASAGSGAAHNNTGLRVLGTFYRKL
jgi:hypothetical protein